MKLVKETIKKTYELTYLIAGDLLDADVAKIKKEMADLVEKHKGEIVKEEDWGRKNLAYKIKEAGKTFAEAVYIHNIIELPAQEVQKLDKALSLDHKIIRHLLVVASEEDATETESSEEK